MNDGSDGVGVSASATVRIFDRPDGKRRVVVLRHARGWFTFAEQAVYDTDDHETGDRRSWASLPSGGDIYGTAAEAEREAKATIGWLRIEPTT